MHKLELVTYGCGEFDSLRFNAIKNIKYRCKPSGGLWSSPVASGYGWKDWCESESFGCLKNSFNFSFSGNTLVIDSVSDLAALPMLPREKYPFDRDYPDFERLLADGVDAIHLTENGQGETRFSEPDLYGWDCETVFIMNPDCIYIRGASK